MNAQEEAHQPSQPDQAVCIPSRKNDPHPYNVFGGREEQPESPKCFGDYSARFDGRALLCDLGFFRLQCARKTAGDDSE